MKITVYCDREGILRYNPDGWPEPPKPHAHDHYHMESANYKVRLEKAKSESVPFWDQQVIKQQIASMLTAMLPFPVNDVENMVVPDAFYDVEIDGVIEIADQICQYKRENECYTRKIARIIPMYKQLSYKEQEYKEMIDTIKLLSTEEGIEYLKKILS